jgi:hypothetical protein
LRIRARIALLLRNDDSNSNHKKTQILGHVFGGGETTGFQHIDLCSSLLTAHGCLALLRTLSESQDSFANRLVKVLGVLLENLVIR